MKDLQIFLDLLEKEGELKRIKVQVSKDLEITEITDRVCKSRPEENKALLFENIEGYDIPVVTNMFGSERRMALCFGLNGLKDLSERVNRFINFDLKGGLFDILGKGLDFYKLIRGMTSVRVVESPPCQEVKFFEDANLYDLPIPKFWPKDAGPYITLPQVITHNPKTKKRNVGMYRLQVIGEKRLIVHWQMHKNGREHEEIARSLGMTKIPCAVVLGGDPLCIWASILPLPLDIDEYMIVPLFREKPVEMAKCLTQPLHVPANAEIVLEGYIDLTQTELEGPFGDHTGYYTPLRPYPVFELTAITRKKKPVFPATVTGIPPMEDFWMGKAVERFFLPFIKLALPEIVDINMPSFGVFHNLLLVSIKKRYPGQARKVINAIWGLGMLALTKAIIVLDEDVDLSDLNQVFWQVFGSTDWKRDIEVSYGPLDELDHASSDVGYGGKIGIDATRKLKEEGYKGEWPEKCVMSEDVKRKIDEIWKSIG